MTEPLARLPDGTPSSPKTHDGDQSNLDSSPEVFLRGCGLPQAWAGQPQWRILETGFGQGLNFLATWKAWRDDPQRPRMLHFISCESRPVSGEDLLRAAPQELLPLARELSGQCWGLLPGVHRLAFDEGRVLLTLYIGDAQAMLRQQTPRADSIYLSGPGPRAHPELWSTYMLKAVARCCRRGTRLASRHGEQAVREDLAQCGFETASGTDSPADHGVLHAVFNPKWEPRPVREAVPDVSIGEPGTCLVIGAGLAGSACAASLARRGWQVTVVDAKGPAAGASGLPAGVFAPHVSPDDSLLSRLSRAGVRSTMQVLQGMPRDAEWSGCGVLEHRVDGTPGIPDAWRQPAHPGADWSQPATAEQRARNGVPLDAIACWHPRAGWVKPPSLVRHQLSHGHIRVMPDARVARLVRGAADGPARQTAWQALDGNGAMLAQADMVIVTAGFDSQALLENRWQFQALRGQISWGYSRQSPPTTPWPREPVNGHGNLVPRFPIGSGPEPEPGWVIGSTFERNITELPPGPADVATAHASNFKKLGALAPALAASLETGFEQARMRAAQGIMGEQGDGAADAPAVRTWGAVRCASHDRLPIVGPVDHQALPGLWVCTAMGSRGLTLSALCAELLAARLHHEPLPTEAAIAQHLGSERMEQSRHHDPDA
ncbi:FAD-dependent 5-carboxymethylaminomethyl-2-thiouridine(34) oxidoreductase MnmC [Diaphorobacter ruginosibacter]|uniref:FAD-dependent 5-carboxymethylaminomethyl-2-thiouridine(34) oxidoreductase MnmC n=1 Tax=Diaphorobacter ruginosibacter TaxID=1715720 RepID=UPI0033416CBC